MTLRPALAATAVLMTCVLASPGSAQGIPLPQPRPASLVAGGATQPAIALTAEALAASRSAPASSGSAVPGPPVSLVPQPGSAPVAQPASARAAQQGSAVARVNTYFNGIRTLVGNFSQIAPDGSRTQGKFFLAKPGRVRFYYQAPSTTDIIADGKSLVVRDRKLATQDVYPLGQTPLKFLLDPNLDLTRDSKVVGVYEDQGVISVAIEESSTFGGKARVMMVFGDDAGGNIELKQWTITDAQGLNTTVAVSELDQRAKPDDKLFRVDYTRYHR
jgi:outer membrane lipoprotein-sorting protein